MIDKDGRIIMPPQYHTLNEGIPANWVLNDPHIGMDTHINREGLHLWIRNGEKLVSVHLSRKDAMNLVEEIRFRLF